MVDFHNVDHNLWGEYPKDAYLVELSGEGVSLNGLYRLVFFTDSALWAGSVIESTCLSVCLSVFLSV